MCFYRYQQHSPRYQGPGAAAREGAGAAPEASRLGPDLLQRRLADGLRRAAIQRGRGAAATRAAAGDGTHRGEQERPGFVWDGFGSFFGGNLV